MNRRNISLTLLIFLTFFSIHNSQAAAPKVGLPCPKVGIKQVSKGTLFTCIKSGKKIVWNKGVVVKAAPKITSSPSPSVEPSVQKSPAPTSSSTPTPTLRRAN